VRLKRSETQPTPDHVTFDLCGIDVSEEIDRNKSTSLTSHLANLTFSTLGSLRGHHSSQASCNLVKSKNLHLTFGTDIR
jgi:hypothetical protein